MPLRCEHLSDVALHPIPALPTLVDAVDEEQRTARQHHLPQEAVNVRLRTVDALQKGVDPVPRSRKHGFVEQQPTLQLLNLDEDGHQLEC
eukprot:5748616-Prymnesium_polylepis.2